MFLVITKMGQMAQLDGFFLAEVCFIKHNLK
jgi:hypothetical protein